MAHKMPSIIGLRIIGSRHMTQAEMTKEGWYGGMEGPAVVLVLENGMLIYPSRDDEGNGPGVLFCNYKGLGGRIG
jgi:hypothetical protein